MIPNVDLINDNVFIMSILKILSKNRIVTLIKDCHSVVKLGKMACNNPNVDIVNGQILSIHSK